MEITGKEKTPLEKMEKTSSVSSHSEEHQNWNINTEVPYITAYKLSHI